MRELGHLALDVHEQHLEQPRALQPLDASPGVELSADWVDEASEVRHDALTRAERRAALKGRRRLERDGAGRGRLVGMPVLDTLAVVFDVLLNVLGAQPLDLAPCRLGRLCILVAQAGGKVGREAHLLLVQVLGLHLAHPAAHRLVQLPAHDHRPVAREIREIVEPGVSLAVKLLDGHIVLEAPADKGLDE